MINKIPFLYKAKLTINFYYGYPLIIPIDPDEMYNNIMKDIKFNDELTIELKYGDTVVSSTFETKNIRAMFLEKEAIE